MPERERYAINLPGRADTDGPALVSVAEMEAFVSRFIDAEVEGDYLLVGHSLGGGVAIEHALSCASEHLKGIVLLATGARLRVHPMILQLFEQAVKSGASISPLPPGLYEQGTDPRLVAAASKARELTPIETGHADWRACDSFNRMEDVAKIRVPALIVTGSNDALTPVKYGQYLGAQIPHNKLYILDGAGHMLLTERAAELATLMTAS